MTKPDDVVDRLCVAVNRHDLDDLTACFAADYRNETPVHPERGFVGREQVRRNWEQLFRGIPDISSRITARAETDTSVWTEWEMRGTRRDGTAHHLCGVILFGVLDGRAVWARFYLEPVDESSASVGDAVRAQVVRETAVAS